MPGIPTPGYLGHNLWVPDQKCNSGGRPRIQESKDPRIQESKLRKKVVDAFIIKWRPGEIKNGRKKELIVEGVGEGDRWVRGGL